MKIINAWIKASRFASQSYIFVPLLAGQMFHVMIGGKLDWTIFTIVHLYGLFMQLYIVYANDYADIETDRINQTYTIFSGGSRVLCDGALSRSALGYGGILMAGLCLVMGILLALFFGRILSPALILMGILLLWMYSFGPVKLSYRGGGEILQMFGVGCVLPLVGFYAQSGSISRFPLETLAVILPTQLACAMATSIPDFSSDKQSDKRTSTVLLGQHNVRIVVILLNLAAIASFFAIYWARLSEVRVVLPFAVLASIALGLFPLVKQIEKQRAIFLFVMFSIVLTTGIMGSLAYVASNMLS